MKLKFLIFALLMPLSLMAANTNVFDRVLVRSTFQFIDGTPGAGKVLTSDAAGFSSWITPTTGAQTNAVNNWLALQRFFNGTENISTNVGSSFAPAALWTNSTISGLAKIFASDASTMDFTLTKGGGGGTLNLEATAGNRSIISMNGFIIADSTGQLLSLGSGSSTVTIGAAAQTLVLGTASSSALTINAATAAIPNNLNIGSGALNINNSSGVVTNSGGIVSAGNLTANGGMVTAAGTTANLSTTNVSFQLVVNGVTAQITGCYVTNVMADFPNILAASFADLTYPVSNTVFTNMVGLTSHPLDESGALVIDCITSNAVVTLRAKNVGAVAVDQGNLQYRIQVNVIPIQ